MAIKAGDVVKLKSGGTKMVVSHFSDDGSMVQCYWQNVTSEGAEARGNVYPLVTIELDAPATPNAEPAAGSKGGETPSSVPQSSVDGASSPAGRRASWLTPRS